MLAILENGREQPVLISIRGDQELNETKLSNEISKFLNKNLIALKSITEDDLDRQGLINIPFGSIGPDLEDVMLSNASSWNKKIC